jgi:hypothetical protein
MGAVSYDCCEEYLVGRCQRDVEECGLGAEVALGFENGLVGR